MAGKRANGEGTIYKYRDGFAGQITVSRNPVTGRPKRKTFYGATQAEVRKQMTATAHAVDDGTYIEPSRLTVGQWLDIWKNTYLGNVKPDTKDRYEMDIRLYLKPNLGAVKLMDLSPHMIQDVYNKLQRGTDKQKQLSAKSIRNMSGTLHSALEKAVVLSYIPRNPTKGCTKPRVEKKEMQAIKDDDINRFFSAVKDHQFELVYLMDMFIGMRQGEILGLAWDCIDLDDGTIFVKQQLKKNKKTGDYYFAPLKTDKTRTLTISLYVQNLLRKQRAKQKEWQFKAGSVWNNAMGLVFTNEIGRYLIGGVVYNNLKKIVRKLGLDAVRFHDLRHSYALYSLQNGDDIKTLQENLGHAQISTTLDVYGHVSERMKKESAARMDAFIDTLSKG